MSPIDMFRPQWGARPPKRRHVRVDHTHVELHHSVSSYHVDTVSAARSIQNFHMDTRGWNDIFYNLFIHRGRVIEGRGLSNQSHGTALTVCVIGNHETDELRPADKAAIERVLAFCPGRNPKAATFPDYHKARADREGKFHSACPGRNIIRLIQAGAFTPGPAKEDFMAALSDEQQQFILEVCSELNALLEPGEARAHGLKSMLAAFNKLPHKIDVWQTREILADIILNSDQSKWSEQTRKWVEKNGLV